MSEIVFGTGAIVRPILDRLPSPPPPDPQPTTTATLRGPVQLCVNDGCTCDGFDSPGYCGPPWMRRVIVRITPVLAVEPPGPVPPASLDASGQALHCVWRFPCQQDLRACITGQGIRRVSGWSPGYGTKEPVFVESNGGSFRIPRGVDLFFGGGAVGSAWNVDVQELLDHNWGCPAHYWLDTFASADGTPVVRPMEHTVIQPLAGSLTLAGAAVTTPGALSVISLAMPIITTGANTLYRTGIEL